MSPDPGVSVKPKLFPTVCANDSLDGWMDQRNIRCMDGGRI